MIVTLLVLSVAAVAFTNGANANFTGVASLYGSGTTSLHGAVIWGTVTMFAGSLTALFLTRGLLSAFSGKGLVPDSLTTSPDFLCAVALGGAGTSFLATRLGFPVSTTHALVGSLIGAGLAGGGKVDLTALTEVHFGSLHPFIGWGTFRIRIEEGVGRPHISSAAVQAIG